MARITAKASWSQVAAWRFARHGLARRAAGGSVVEVARSLCGLHAQVMSSAELTAWARVEDLPADAVSRALWEDRTLVKTWAMRGTLHLLPTDELALWHGGLAGLKHFLTPGWARGFGLAPGQIEQVIDAAGVVLQGGRMLTREELAGAVAAQVGDPALGETLSHSFGSTLKPAAFRGKLVFGPSDGQKVRFVAPEGWTGDGAVPQPAVEPAMEEIVLRCLAVHGPLTREELTRWWAAKAPDTTRALKRLGGRVAPIDVEGQERWARAEDAEALCGGPVAREDGPVALLPAFDQYVVAATRHSDALTLGAASQARRIYRPQGWLTPVVCVDGRFAGVWRHERRGARGLLVEVEPFAPRVPAAVRAGVEAEAQRLAAFLGGELDLRWVT
jgi:hypothetical protein